MMLAKVNDCLGWTTIMGILKGRSLTKAEVHNYNCDGLLSAINQTLTTSNASLKKEGKYL